MATAAKPFEPIGVEARWRPVYRHLASLGIGDVANYDTLSRLAEVDTRVERGPIYQAMRHLEDEDKRTIECVRSVGYRIVDAPEHERLASAHQKRGQRQLAKSKRKYRSADRTRLTPEAAERFAAAELRIGQVESQMRRLRKRQEVVEQKTELTEKAQEKLARDMQQVKDILGRHGLLDEEKAA